MDAYACPRGGWYGFVLAVGRALLPLVPYLGPAIEALLKFQEDRAFNEAIGRMLLPASGVGPAAAAPWNVRRPHLESAVRQAVQHLSPRDRENVRRLLERVSPQAGREELLLTFGKALALIDVASPLARTLTASAAARVAQGRLLEEGAEVDGRYRLLAQAGSGSMGAVYRARDLERERDVALKILWPDLLRSEEHALQFVREMEAAERLDHENIVRLFGSRRGRTTTYVCMEWLETRTLAAFLDTRRKLAWEQALPIAQGLLSALAHAHRQGVPHLGVGPRNILLPRLDVPKLGDFGLAAALGQAAEDAPTGPLMTQDYASPEIRQAPGGDTRSDVYSAGGVVFRMLTGEIPGEDLSPLDAVEGPSLRVREALRAALALAPSQRPEHCAVLLDAFSGAARGPAGGREARGVKGVVRGQEQPPAPPQPRTPAPAQAPEAASPQPATAPFDLTAPPLGDAAPPIGPGTRLGRYVLGERLGEGAKGAVYEAQDEDLKRRVAVKIMRPDALDGDDLTRFQREAELIAGMDHPNLVPIHDVGRVGARRYLIMGLVEGSDLEKAVEVRRRSGSQPEVRWAVEAVRDACLGVGYAHRHGVVHRDLKPANLMQSPDGRVRVLDFGLARARRASGAGITGTHGWIGTPAFMAPEQASGHPDQVDARTDVYALGATLWFLLTGRFPHAGDLAIEIMSRIAKEPTPRVRDVRPEVPESLERILLRAMSKRKEDRYADGDALAAALEAELQSLSQNSQPERRSVPASNDRAAPPAHRPRGRLSPAVLVAGLSVLAGLVLGMIVHSFPREPAIVEPADDGSSRSYAQAMRAGTDAARNGSWPEAVRSFEEAARWRAGDAGARTRLERAKVRAAAGGVSATWTPSPQTGPTGPGAADAALLFLGRNPEGYEEYLEPRTDIVFVLLPGGEFDMGSPADEPGHQDDERRHRVRLTRPFLLGKTEVTNAQYRRFDSSHASRTSSQQPMNDDEQPVVNVTWNDACNFCRWAKLRLPTKAEWEFAARAGDGRVFPWGNAWPPPDGVGNFDAIPGARADAFTVSAPVGRFPPNPWGLHDLAGNVKEWVWDLYGDYPTGEVAVDPTGDSQALRHIVRGGGWNTSERKGLRTAFRNLLHIIIVPDSSAVGFRVARNVP